MLALLTLRVTSVDYMRNYCLILNRQLRDSYVQYVQLRVVSRLISPTE